MTLKKHLNRTLALGLTISSIYVSTHTVYALNEDLTKVESKSTKNVELKVEKKEEIVTTKQAIVKTSVLNVREEASQDSEKVGALVEGMVVTVLETKDEWTKVNYADNKEGWVSSEYIANEKAKVNTAELNLRTAPSTEEEKVEILKNNTELEILNTLEVKDTEEDSTEVWYEVKVIEEESSDKEEVSEKETSDINTEEADEEKIGFVFADYVLTESEEIRLEEEARLKAEAEKKAQAEKEAQVKTQSAVKSNSTSTNTTSNNKQQASSSSSSSSSASLAGTTITVNASAYSGHSITATGTVPRWGTIAVDPSVIPYGTKVYIPMFDKVFIAEDCGSAIKGNKIDIFMNSAQETTSFGRRNIEIKILG